MKLIFQSDRIPRSTTRTQWRAIDRWRRLCEAQLRDIEDGQRATLADLAADIDMIQNRTRRAAYSAIRAQLTDRIINPPVVVYP